MTPPALERWTRPLTGTTLLQDPVRWAAAYRVVAGGLLLAATPMAPALAVWQVVFLVASIAVLVAITTWPRLAPAVRLPTLVADTAIIAAWCSAHPDVPEVAVLFGPVVLGWAIVYRLRWGLVAATCSALAFAVAHGDPPLVRVGILWMALVAIALAGATLVRLLHTQWRRRREQERMRRQDQHQHLEQVGRLAGSVAHEMNNTLTAILGLASLMRVDAPDDSPLAADLEALTQASRDGQELVANLLAMTGRAELRMDVHAGEDFAESAAELLRKTLPRTVRVETQLGRALPHVNIDRGAVARAILDLGLGAHQASRGRDVTLRLCASTVTLQGEDEDLGAGTWLRIDLQDDGPGIAVPPPTYDDAFSMVSRPEGAPLGLSYVHSILSRHGGLARMRRVEGRGSTATLWLPAHGSVSSLSDTSHGVSVRPRLVLVVEDEATIRRAVVRQLHRLHVEAMGAATGADARELAATHRSDISAVMLDIGLPDVDGAALLEELRQMLPHAHLVVSSGALDPQLRSELEHRGANAFLPKPFDRDQLQTVVLSPWNPQRRGSAAVRQGVHSAP